VLHRAAEPLPRDAPDGAPPEPQRTLRELHLAEDPLEQGVPEPAFSAYDADCEEVQIVEPREAAPPKKRRRKDPAIPGGNEPCGREEWHAHVASTVEALGPATLRCLAGSYPVEVLPESVTSLFRDLGEHMVWRLNRTYGELRSCTSLAIAGDGGLHNNLMLRVLRALFEPNGLWISRNESKKPLAVGATGIIRPGGGVLRKIKRRTTRSFGSNHRSSWCK